MTGRIEPWLVTARIQPSYKTIRSDDFERFELPTPEQKLEQRRTRKREARNEGLPSGVCGVADSFRIAHRSRGTGAIRRRRAPKWTLARA
jgi:hypothetical protein